MDMSLLETPPDKSIVKLIGTDNTGEIKKYEFDIPINYSKVKPLTKEFDLMKSFKDGDRSLLIKKVVVSPAATTIIYEYTCPKDEMYSLQLFNENGRLVQSKGNVGSHVVNGDYKTCSFTATFESLKTVPQYLTLNIIDSGEDKMLDNIKYVLMSVKFDLK